MLSWRNFVVKNTFIASGSGIFQSKISAISGPALAIMPFTSPKNILFHDHPGGARCPTGSDREEKQWGKDP